MNDQQLTDLDLDEIAARAAAMYEYADLGSEEDQREAEQLAGTDVPALIETIRRLRQQRRSLLASIARKDARTGDANRALRELLGTDDEPTRNPHTPRLCECGHSHHAHTVPAPHSCFAFGQTCPCPSYRQLPHDKAVAQLETNRRAAAEREAARVAEETHVVADGSDDPEHVDDCPGCGAAARPAAASKTTGPEAVINANEIELEGGDVMLQELSVGDPIEIEKQTGPLSPGIWVITAFETDDRSRARVRRLTREEIEAARQREAVARIYE